MIDASADTYVEGLPNAQKERVSAIRALVHKLVPDVDEKLSYGILGFFLKGKALLYVGGWQDYTSMYPVPHLPDTQQTALEEYRKGKGTLQFPSEQDLPLEFIEAVIHGHHERLLSR